MESDSNAEFAEVFGFIQTGREDVKKMALQGLAQQSQDNKKLFTFLSSDARGPGSIETLLQFLHAGSVNVLGDVLTILINCSIDAACTEALVAHKAVRRTMRLIDSIEVSDHSHSLQRGLEEMALMLLSNLTASHVSAVDDMLQVADEDLRGFYLGKLHTYYTRFAVGANVDSVATAPEQQEVKSDSDGVQGARNTVDDRETEVRREGSSKALQRDLQRWILQILLNVTRTSDGQELFLEDDEWLAALTDCLSSSNVRHRMIAVQCFRNCSLQRERHMGVLRSRCLRVCVERLSDGSERSAEIELLFAEIIANLMQTEEGMELLEELNAKKHLQAAVSGGKTQAGTSEFLSERVLPFLDDVVDAYIMPDGDGAG